MRESLLHAGLLVIAAQSPVFAQSDVDRIEACLKSAAMEEGSLRARLQKAECRGVEPEEIAALHEYRGWSRFLRKAEAPDDLIEVWQTFSSSRSVQAACVRGNPGEMIDTAEASYWNGSRCLILNLVGRTARLSDEYHALGCFFLPREATGGFFGPYSLAIWVADARRRNALVVQRDGKRIEIRLPHPLTPSGDQAMLELAFLERESDEIVFESRAIAYPNGLRSTILRVGDWQRGASGLVRPASATMEWKLVGGKRAKGSYSGEEVRKMGSMRFEFRIEEVSMDGERITSESLVGALADMDEYRDSQRSLVSVQGVDRRIREAASDFFGAERKAETSPRTLVQELIAGAPRSTTWASLVPDELAAEAEKSMDPISIDKNYCGQAALALMARLQGKRLGFSDLLKEDPRECLTLESMLDLARKHSLDLHAIEVDPARAEWSRLRDPFVFLIPGEDAGTHHAAVAQHRDGEVLVWLSPSRALRLRDPREWLLLKPTGILLVAKRDEVVSRGGAPLLWWLAGISALLALLLVGWRALRAGSHRGPVVRPNAVGAAVGVLLAAALAACEPHAPGASTGEAHVSALEMATSFEVRVASGSYSFHDLEVTNDAAVELSFVLHPISCSCIEVPLEPVVLSPRSKTSIRLGIREQGRGDRRERLLLEGHGRTQGRREIDLFVHPIPRLRVDPPGASVTMEPNSIACDAFRITAEGYAQGAVAEPFVASADPRFRIQLLELPREPRDHGVEFPPVRFAVTVAAGEVEPGLHEMHLSLALRRSEAGEPLQPPTGAVTSLSIPVAIRESTQVRR